METQCATYNTWTQACGWRTSLWTWNLWGWEPYSVRWDVTKRGLERSLCMTRNHKREAERCSWLSQLPADVHYWQAHGQTPHDKLRFLSGKRDWMWRTDLNIKWSRGLLSGFLAYRIRVVLCAAAGTVSERRACSRVVASEPFADPPLLTRPHFPMVMWHPSRPASHLLSVPFFILRSLADLWALSSLTPARHSQHIPAATWKSKKQKQITRGFKPPASLWILFSLFRVHFKAYSLPKFYPSYRG